MVMVILMTILMNRTNKQDNLSSPSVCSHGNAIALANAQIRNKTLELIKTKESESNVHVVFSNCFFES